MSMPTAWEPWPGNRKATGPEGAALGLAGAAAASACAGGGRAGEVGRARLALQLHGARFRTLYQAGQQP